ETHFDNLTTYKNRNGGFWGRGEMFVVRNLKSADNAIGTTTSSGAFGNEAFTSLLVDSLVVGETDNIGNPTTPEEIAYGRSLPKKEIPDFPIRGYEYYDYRVDVADTTFMNYQDNEQREAGALSWLMFTSSGATTENTAKNLTFVDAKPVHFPKYDWRFDNDNRGGSAWRSLAIHDLDGSTTGKADSYILLHDGEFDTVATDDSCDIHPSWNASVCTGDVGRLYARSGGAAGGIRAALATPRPPELPVALVRNGKEHTITGNQSTVRSGSEIQVVTERPELSLSVSEMDKDSWLLFELPGFASVDSGTEQDSIDAVRVAKETACFRGHDALWVKLVVPQDPEQPVRP